MEIKVTQNEKTKEIFATRLNQLKGDMNLSELEKVTEISRQTLNKYLNCIALPNSDSLIVLADTFNVSCDYLLGRDEGTEHNIDYIMKETGLSENAIKQLKDYTYDEDFHLELFAINQIIEASGHTDFLAAFAKYISTPKIDDDDLDDIYSMILPFFEGVDVPLIGVKNNESVVEYEHISSDDLLYHLLLKEYNSLLEHIKHDKKTKSKLMKHLIDLLKPYYEDELYNVYVYSMEYDDYNIEDLKVDKNVLNKVMQKYINEKELESKKRQEEIINNLPTND